MSGKPNKLVNQESRENYGEEAAEGTTAILQGDDEFYGADNKFEESRAEENAFNAIRTEESAARERLQRAGILSGHATGTENKPEEDKE